MKSLEKISVKKTVCIILILILSPLIGYVFVRHVLKIPAAKPLVPISSPNESNRMHVALGHFSIIMPPNWDLSCYDTDMYHILANSHPDHPPMSSFPLAWIRASISAEEIVKEEQMEKTSFQGQPAYHKTIKRPPRKLWGPSGYTYVLCFERNEEWFQLSYSVNREQEKFPPPIILEYFNTFRYEEPVAEQAQQNDHNHSQVSTPEIKDLIVFTFCKCRTTQNSRQ